MPDYSKGKIYTIRCRTDDTMIYVGSTIQSLAKRWGGHKKDSKGDKDKNMLLYLKINGDWDNWFIELYELYPCSCKEELHKKEGEIIRLIGTLNSRIAGRTGKEWYAENKERHAESQKKWNEANKEYNKNIHREWYENNKEIVLERVKKNYENNKDKIAEYKKEYAKNNKEKIAIYMKEYAIKKKALKNNIVI